MLRGREGGKMGDVVGGAGWEGLRGPCSMCGRCTCPFCNRRQNTVKVSKSTDAQYRQCTSTQVRMYVCVCTG